MSNTIINAITGMDVFKNSSYHSILIAERDEIMKLKWIESEKAQRDIGISKARWIWEKYRVEWLKHFKENIRN